MDHGLRLIIERFWMELYSHNKWVACILKPFDYTVISNYCMPQTTPKLPNCLMMRTIHHHPICAIQSRKESSGKKGNGMDTFLSSLFDVMSSISWQLVIKVLIQISTINNIELMGSATDCQDWHIPLKSLFN